MKKLINCFGAFLGGKIKKIQNVKVTFSKCFIMKKSGGSFVKSDQ